MITISVIIRVKNEEKAIGKLIEQILCQKIGEEYEILVIDDCSTDNTRSIVARYPVRLIKLKPKQFTFGYALNLGGYTSKGNILVNVSADCIPANDRWLKILTRPLINYNAIATYGRQIPNYGANPFEEQTLESWYPPYSSYNKLDLPRKAFSNANCAIQKKVWIHYPFNEDIVSMEDWLWYEQVKNLGQVEYMPDAPVYHSHPVSRLGRLYRRVYRDGIATIYLRKFYNIDVRVRRKTDSSIMKMTKSAIYYILWTYLFLMRRGYYKALILFPFYQIIHDIAYYKGIQEGKRLYL